MEKPNRRIWILLALALILGGVWWYDHSGGSLAISSVANTSLKEFTSSDLLPTGQTLSSLQHKKNELMQFQSKEAEIDEAYFQMAPGYADKVANLAGLLPSLGDNSKMEAENIIREKLDAFDGIDNVKISPADPENLAKGVQQVLADVSYNTRSSQDALASVMMLGNARNGIQWRTLAVSTDRVKKEVSVNGRISIVLVEAAE